MINLQIIGAQKAGTTALASFLNQHPGVYVVEGKEAHVFDHPEFAAQEDKRAFTTRKYNKRLTGLKNQRIVCDATPITIFNQEFLTPCVEYNPQAKFIVMLRDPVERAVSHYKMSLGRNQESKSMFQAFLMEPQRMKAVQGLKSWPFDSPYRNHSYLSRGCYSGQLKMLFDLVPNDQILVLRQEDLKHHHQQTLIEIFKFLDIQKHPIAAETVFSTEKVRHRWTDRLARLYASLYFRIKGENQRRWAEICGDRFKVPQTGK